MADQITNEVLAEIVGIAADCDRNLQGGRLWKRRLPIGMVCRPAKSVTY
ncbi:MAG TPA: hypothetical protein VHE82_01290 [Gemmatimonadaceae bacterium]|nr:hypothetical protein [Gemmatimonadaceae bacterium]